MAKPKATKSTSNHEFLGQAKDLLSEVWDHWTTELGHTPAIAKEKITKAIKEFHKAETKRPKPKSSAKTPAKSKLKRKVKRVISKAKKK